MDNQEIIELYKEHIGLIDNLQFAKYETEENALPFQDFLDAERLFYTRIVEYRRRLKKSQKERIDNSLDKLVWKYPDRAERTYFKFLEKLFSRITEKVEANLKYAKLTSMDWSIDSADVLVEIARAEQATIFERERALLEQELSVLYEEINVFNEKEFDKVKEKATGSVFTILEPWGFSTKSTWIQNNYNLTKALSEEYIKRLSDTIALGQVEELSEKEIADEIKKLNKRTTGYRSQLIAADQTGRLNGILSKFRQKEAGLDLYTWNALADKKTRPLHRQMGGSINKWSDSSVYAFGTPENVSSRPSEMQGAIPGSQINCRCTASPYLKQLIDEADKQIEQENT